MGISSCSMLRIIYFEIKNLSRYIAVRSNIIYDCMLDKRRDIYTLVCFTRFISQVNFKQA